MRLTFVHAGWMIRELLRQPAYVASTLAFPALFYLIFAVPESKDVASSNFLMASFSGFAIFGVIFLQFGVGLAQERTRSWYHYLRTLPMPSVFMLLARLVSSMAFSLLAAGVIVLLALGLTDAELKFSEWVVFIVGLLLGGLTFSFMGLALGYWASEKSSLPIGNMIYLPLSFAGGLWKPPSILPDRIREISTYLPTRHYGDVLWAAVQGTSVPTSAIQGLLLYGVAFSAIAYWGFRRDHLKRFS